MPPLAVTAPEPEIVPLLRVARPLTVTSPVPVSVPPPDRQGPADRRGRGDRERAAQDRQRFRRVRLLIESVTLSEWTTFAGDVDRDVISRYRDAVGAPVPALSQLLSPASPVHDTAESSVLGSIHSSRGPARFRRIEFVVSIGKTSEIKHGDYLPGQHEAATEWVFLQPAIAHLRAANGDEI